MNKETLSRRITVRFTPKEVKNKIDKERKKKSYSDHIREKVLA